MRFWLVIVLILGLLTGGLAIIAYYAYQPPQQTAATSPVVVPGSKPAEKQTNQLPPTAPRIQTYSDLLRSLPGMADAAIGDEKLPLEQAARIGLPHWAYVCSRRDLWISHPDAPSLTAVGDEGSRAIHLTREQVVFVHWFRSGRSFRPLPVYRDEAGGFRVFRKSGEPVKLQRYDYHWPYAVSIGDGFAVPTDQGVSFISVGSEIREEYRQLTDKPEGVPCIELTQSGFIAWVTDTPAEVAWYSSGTFQQLPGNWSEPYLHLVPFTDGSVLQIIGDAMGKARLQIANLETTAPDAAKVKKLVEALSDDDAENRDDAHAQLAAMGPAAWEVLAGLAPEAHGEARVRLEEILRSRSRPALGRFELLDGLFRPVWRVRDGVVYLAEAGVQVQSGGTDEQITPAWVAIRRGRPIELLPPTLARHLAIGTVNLYCVGNEWIVSDEMSGAQLFFGQELFPLTQEKDFRYRALAGIDRQSRVLLAPVDAKAYGTDFLLMDPWVADPTPLLQIWTISAEGGEAGWTDDGWPAVKRGGAFALKQESWDGLKGELTTASVGPATRPSGEGTLTQVAGQIDGSTVWVSGAAFELQNAQGKSIRQARPDGVPSEIIGGVVSGDRLYLVHPGSGISRLRINPGSERPFSLEAVFAQNVPYIAGVLRMWVDPAGRICIVTPDPKLVILFTGRRIPSAIMDLIPDSDLKQARPK